MSQQLLDVVRTELLPVLATHDFRVVESEETSSFDNAYVILEGASLRLRVVRERAIVTLDVAPTCAPNAWVDSAVLIDYLGLSADAGFHSADVRDVARGIGRFIRSLVPDLQSVFDPNRWRETQRELEALKARRAKRLFG